MSVIYKYPLDDFATEIELPTAARVLTVQLQGDQLMLWAVVDPKVKPAATRRFVVVGTGHSFVAAGKVYVATVQVGPFVWHVFEDAR